MTNQPPIKGREPWRRGGPLGFDDLAAFLAGAPELPGALCRGRHAQWDYDADGEPPEAAAARDERLARAAQTCRRCPELAACRDWLDSLPRQRQPTGAVAGLIVPPLTVVARPVRRERPNRRPTRDVGEQNRPGDRLGVLTCEDAQEGPGTPIRTTRQPMRRI